MNTIQPKHRNRVILFLTLLLLALIYGTAQADLPVQTAVSSDAATTGSDEQMALSDQPLSLQYAVSESMGRSQNAYHLQQTAQGLKAETPSQGYTTTFDAEGITLAAGQTELGLRLTEIGYGDNLQPVAAALPQADGNRVEYRRGSLTEWYVNGPLGLQQGFTLAARPELPSFVPAQVANLPGLSGQELTLALALSDDWQSDISADRRSLTLSGADGTRLLYGGLLVIDASGQELPARFERAQENGDRLSIRINDSAAHYPLTIDPFIQQAYLKASNVGAGDEFGFSVAISGDTAVVGAYGEDSDGSDPNDNSAGDSGAAYIFVRNGTGWSQQAYLKASNVGEYDYFGRSVAISGDTAVVGATGEDSDGSDPTDNSAGYAGAAYVFVRDGTSWSQQAYLKAANVGASDYFGYSVAISGDTVVAGAPFEDSNGSDPTDNSVDSAGAAYIFVRDGTSWSQQAYLKAANVGSNDYFGYSVAVSGDTAVVGAYGEDSGNSDPTDNSAGNAGAAYVFLRSGSTWTQQAYLKAANVGAGDRFGRSVAISGDTAVVGAFGESSNGSDPTDNSAPGAGAAYVFVRDGTSWSQQAYLKAANVGSNDSFGWSVAISGDTAVVGALFEDSNGSDPTNNSAIWAGAAYVFVRDGTGWSQQAYLKASNVGEYDYFGRSVAISNGTAVVGAYGEDSNGSGAGDNSLPDAGAAYFFVQGEETWTQQTYSKASNAGAGDLFGYAVAISGDTVVVGAYGEASSSDPNDNSASEAGAAYVFVRNGSSWSQQAYLKADIVGAGDRFGTSVAISGDTAVVGAYGEDSDGSDPNDNSAGNAGAAYVFVRNGSSWSQQAYLKAANVGADDLFGFSVAISGDTAVIGARDEDSGSSDPNDNSADYAGATYVFLRSGSTWTQQAYLKAANVGANDWFGYSVAISGDTAVVGASGEDSGSSDPNDNSAGNAGAAYVFVRNGSSWSQQVYLKAANAEAYDYFGESVAISGDTTVVGAYGEDSGSSDPNDNSASYAGAAYVFVRDGSNWSQQATLKAANVEGGDFFGESVTISGDTIVVGASSEKSGNSDPNDNSVELAGAAYVFVRDGSSWTQQAYLKAINVGAEDYFGWSVAISGDAIVVGAPYEDSNGSGASDNSASWAGAAYFFVQGETWTQQTYSKASNVGAGDQFGYAVAINGDTAVVGAIGEDSNGSSETDESAPTAGAAYIFVRSGGTWTQQAYLKAANAGDGDRFGHAVAISGDTVVVSTPYEDSDGSSASDNSASSAGAAYIFVRSGGVWTQQAYLKAANAAMDDNFGDVVAISGNTAVVGAYGEDSNGSDPNDNSASYAGAAYIFVRNGSSWSQQAYLKAANVETYDNFGNSVAISGDTAVVGAYGEDSNGSDPSDNSAGSAGAAYVFVRDGSSWSQQAYLKADIAEAFDAFGISVAISGDTVMVGAPYEDSNGSDPNDNSADNAGAAYVFLRSGNTWTQQAYLKTSNVGEGDEFGFAVATSGDTVVVGARLEDSYSSSDPTDSSTPNAGAAYIFVRNGSSWSQQAYLKADNAGAGDYFGRSVAISGDTIVVGAPYEDSNGSGTSDNSALDAGAAYFFQNNTPATLTITKEATPKDGSDFDFTISGPGIPAAGPPNFTLDDEATQTDSVEQSITYNELTPGTYEISEIVPANWQLDSAVCSGGSDSGSLNNETLSVGVGAGEDITCTFTNTTNCAPAPTPTNVTITKNSNNVDLAWDDMGIDVDHYEAWQSDPNAYYFIPAGDCATNSACTVVNGTNVTLANSNTNQAFGILAVNSCGEKSDVGTMQRLGIFHFTMTPGSP